MILVLLCLLLGLGLVTAVLAILYCIGLAVQFCKTGMKTIADLQTLDGSHGCFQCLSFREEQHAKNSESI